VKKLSIVVITYNEGELLSALLTSIRKQSFKDYELIVADNGSIDDTIEIAYNFGATVVAGGMPGKGRNCGASVASGEYILFLDADVELPCATFLADVLVEFNARKLGAATVELVPNSFKTIDINLHKVYNVFLRAAAYVWPCAPGSFILVKREIHNIIGGFDEDIKLGEDVDYAHRASKVGKFRVLKSGKLNVSVRRLDRDGRLNIVAKYMLSGLYILLIGKIKTNLFKYTFGHKKS
jgi:glycosyltransferase involved in cell wall biosynthesis